jgi:hypothetical protein
LVKEGYDYGKRIWMLSSTPTNFYITSGKKKKKDLSLNYISSWLIVILYGHGHSQNEK